MPDPCEIVRGTTGNTGEPAESHPPACSTVCEPLGNRLPSLATLTTSELPALGTRRTVRWSADPNTVVLGPACLPKFSAGPVGHVWANAPRDRPI